MHKLITLYNTEGEHSDLTFRRYYTRCSVTRFNASFDSKWYTGADKYKNPPLS